MLIPPMTGIPIPIRLLHFDRCPRSDCAGDLVLSPVEKGSYVSGHEGGRWLTVDQVLDIRHQLKQIQKRIADSRPFAQCKNWPNCKRGCRVCDGAGWIPKRLKEVVK